MNKTLWVIGKALIVFSLLWPLPLEFILLCVGWFCELQPEMLGFMRPLLTWLGGVISPFIWGQLFGYLWPLLITLVLGLALCCILGYRASSVNQGAEGSASPFRLLFQVIKWAVYGILGFYVLVLAIIGIYYTLFTKYVEIIVPIGAATAIVGYLLYIGWKVYTRNNKDE